MRISGKAIITAAFTLFCLLFGFVPRDGKMQLELPCFLRRALGMAK